MRSLDAQPLTPEAFAEYGQVLGPSGRPPDIAKGHLDYWHHLAEVGFTERPVWGLLRVRTRPMVLTELERHSFAHEVFVPLGSGVSVMPFALGGNPDVPGGQPDLATLRLFRLDGTAAVVVGRGVWHAPAFPVTSEADFLLALEARTPDRDLDIRAIEPVALHH